MQTNRLGCFSFSAIAAALITTIVIVVLTRTQGHSMFSPGPLNAQTGAALGGVISHAATGGNCAACHVAPWSAEIMADRCGKCHADIVGDMSKIAKAHAEMMHKESSLSCAPCHPDHRGPDAPLILPISNADFPHAALGFSMKGHQNIQPGVPFVCEDCHPQSIKQFDMAACVDCHSKMDQAFMKAHSLSWGEDCFACHDGVDTYNKHFDHGKVPFALTGAHVEVDCYTCHTDARTLADLKATPRDCLSCHRKDEAHQGRFGLDCGKCHSMEAWTPADFDHNLAVFKLEGKHVDVACEKCHVTKPYLGTPMECFACHEKDDKHKGAFSTDCAACHTTMGWDASPFDHYKSNFPLIAGHANVPCESCHKDRQYANASTACTSCHHSAWHGEAFGANCLDCHNMDTWGNPRYTLGHPWFSHPREEGVSINNCRACHPKSVYEADCTSCHGRKGVGD